MFLHLFVLVILCFISYTYLINKRKEAFWSQYGVPFYKGPLGFGFIWEVIFARPSLFEVIDKIYQKYPNNSVIATKVFTTPIVIVKDPENVRNVLAGDFNTFSHRGFDVNWEIDRLADNVLFMNGIRWKLTRQKFTPLFTSAKLRNMFYIMNNSAQDFVNVLKNDTGKGNTFHVLTKFCSASIAASVFGIETTSSDMESPFLDIAMAANGSNSSLNWKFILIGLSNKLYAWMKIKLFSEFEEFFIGAMKRVLRVRKESKVKRHDFADLCLEVQKNGTLRDPTTGYEIEATDELMAAQAFFFFIAGVDPSAVTMHSVLFELAKNTEILKRIHKEIDELFDGEMTFEKVANFEYLDRVIDESMRMYPPIGLISRMNTQDAVLPFGNIPLTKGISIQIPIFSIHYDPKYYPEPYVFDPERFTEEAKRSRPNYTYLPFGEGNRMCLGMRFARMQVKIGLIYILRNFTVTSTKPNLKVVFKKNTVQVRPDNFHVDIVPRIA